MDQSLKVNTYKDQAPYALDKRNSNSLERPFTGSNEFARDRDDTRDVANLQQNVKSAVVRNKLKMIAFLNLIPLCGLIYSLANPKFVMVGTAPENGEIWINFIVLNKYYNSKVSVSAYELISSYRSSNCDNNRDLCEKLSPFVISGYVSAVAVIIGLLLQIFNILQILMVAFRRHNCIRDSIPVDLLHIMIMFIYAGGFAYWYFATGFFTDIFKSFTDFISALGPTMGVYIGSVILYIVLASFFKVIYKKTLKNARLNQLLRAEHELMAELDDGSYYSSPTRADIIIEEASPHK